MDKNKQPGIIFKKIYLNKINFEFFPENNGEKDISLDIKSNININKDKTKLAVSLAVDLMKDIEKPPFNLYVEMIGIFQVAENAANMDVEQFATENAPALMIPFIREVIASITSRGPMSQLLLPPFNVMALIKASAEKKILQDKQS